MSVGEQEQQLLSQDAFLAFNKIGGKIQQLSIEILRRRLNEKGVKVAQREDVQDAYWEACQEIVGPRK